MLKRTMTAAMCGGLLAAGSASSAVAGQGVPVSQAATAAFDLTPPAATMPVATASAMNAPQGMVPAYWEQAAALQTTGVQQVAYEAAPGGSVLMAGSVVPPAVPPNHAVYPAPITQPAVPATARPAYSPSAQSELVGFRALDAAVLNDTRLMPDRPFFLPRATVVPVHGHTLEGGFTGRIYDTEGEDGMTDPFGDPLFSDFNITHGDLLFRAGIAERTELRLRLAAERISAENDELADFFGDVDELASQTDGFATVGVKRLFTSDPDGQILFSGLAEAGFASFSDELLDVEVESGTYFFGRFAGLSQFNLTERWVSGGGLGLRVRSDRGDNSELSNAALEYSAFTEYRFDRSAVFTQLSGLGSQLFDASVGAYVPLGDRLLFDVGVGYTSYSEEFEDEFGDEADFSLSGVLFSIGLSAAF